jgi:hypothetical protein
MGIPQFVMIITLSQHRWFYKLEYWWSSLLLSSLFHVLIYTSLMYCWLLCSLHIGISPNSSSAFNVVLHVGSRRIYEVSASHFWHH